MSRTPQSPTGNRVAVTTYVAAALLLVGGIASVPLLREQRRAFARETIALRSAAGTVATTLDSLADITSRTSATLSLERARAESRAEKGLHLVVAVDSGTVALMRDGMALRTMSARFRGALPTRGSQAIARIVSSVAREAAPTVDSLGQIVRIAAPETKVERITLTDGTILEGGDAADAILGGVDVEPGPRRIVVSRRDFAAVRPNLVRGMKAILF
jgi:hypothetical protein